MKPPDHIVKLFKSNHADDIQIAWILVQEECPEFLDYLIKNHLYVDRINFYKGFEDRDLPGTSVLWTTIEGYEFFFGGGWNRNIGVIKVEE